MDITINGKEIDLKMKLGENGVAFFAELTTDADIPEYLVTSPVPGSSYAPVDGKVSQQRCYCYICAKYIYIFEIEILF